MQVIIFKDKILYFSICFILVTIFGTLSHEFGHLVVAKILGYDTILHHSSMEWTNEVKESVIEIYIKNESIIEERKPFHNSIQYYKKLDKINYDEFLIVLGGVLQTIITGSIAFSLLIYNKKKKIGKILFWFLVFLSLFWSRQVFNLFKGVLQFCFKKSNSLFWGDELKLSTFLNLFEGTISLFLGTLGILILSILLFKIIPLKYRLSFIIASFIGSLLGYTLWMILIGPLILP